MIFNFYTARTKTEIEAENKEKALEIFFNSHLVIIGNDKVLK